jgi:hypothetical protein
MFAATCFAFDPGLYGVSIRPNLVEGCSLGFEFRTTLGNQNTRRRQTFYFILLFQF